MKGEGARVTKSIENPAAGSKLCDRLAIFALIQKEAGLLAFANIHEELQAIFLDDARLGRHSAPKRPVLDIKAFELADIAFGAEVDAFGTEQLDQQFGQYLFSLGQAKGGELHHQPPIVLINGQPGEAVRFTKDQPAS